LAEAKPAPCQVRSKTGNPCPRRAEVEILGVAFCDPCAREQEAYFTIGELTDEEEEAWDFRTEALDEALERMRRKRVSYGRPRSRAASRALGRRDEREPLALRRG
jgi:hypothetical protein